ncbi:MAG: HlyC/CorC family transporter [Clostridiales bacterium]|nr:HlyC/CorC family transporter [Clostridiales bacterium]
MMPYLFIVFLLICSAFFSSTEIAFAAVNKTRLKQRAEDGSLRNKWALEISDHYDKALCTILIGNNLVNIASSSVATVIAMSLVGDAGVAVATGVMTVLLLIFGEILPKQLAKQFCDSYAVTATPLLRVIMIITSPLVYLFMKMIAVLSHLWGGSSQDDSITIEDIASIIETVEEEGVIDEERSELLQSAIEFDETEAREIITHRMDMLALDINDDSDAIIAAALDSHYSRIPIYDGRIDNIIGILHVNHLLRELMDGRKPCIRDLITDVEFVPQSKKLPAVLEQLRQHKNHMAVVTDEYGGTFGIITMEDILEELVGDIWDETDEIDPDITEETEDSFLMDGSMMLSDFLEHIEEEDEELEDHITTVGGWATEVLGDYPEEGQSFQYRSYVVTIEESDEFRVTRLHVQRVPQDETTEDED